MKRHPDIEVQDRSWCQPALAAICKNVPALLVSVVAAKGSAPRPAGTRMLVTDDTVAGTIGGGQLEFHALEKSRELLRDPEAQWLLEGLPLGPAVGQCCGGNVRLLYERLVPADETWLRAMHSVGGRRYVVGDRDGRRCSYAAEAEGRAFSFVEQEEGAWELRETLADQRQPVAIFGLGHVGQALCRALAPLPFRLTAIDTRQEMRDRLAAAGLDVCIVPTRAPALEVAHLPPGSWPLIMTHSHALDFAVATAALLREDLGPVGLIGSMTKRARFLSLFRAETDHSEALLSRLCCPIGLPTIHSKHPAVIAASVAAELLQRKEALHEP